MSSEKDIIPSILDINFYQSWALQDPGNYGIDFDLSVGGNFCKMEHTEDVGHKEEVKHEEEVEHKKGVTFNQVLRSSSNPSQDQIPNIGSELPLTLDEVCDVHTKGRDPGRFRDCPHTGLHQSVFGISTKTHRDTQDDTTNWTTRGEKAAATAEAIAETGPQIKRSYRMDIRTANYEWNNGRGRGR